MEGPGGNLGAFWFLRALFFWGGGCHKAAANLLLFWRRASVNFSFCLPLLQARPVRLSVLTICAGLSLHKILQLWRRRYCRRIRSILQREAAHQLVMFTLNPVLDYARHADMMHGLLTPEDTLAELQRLQATRGLLLKEAEKLDWIVVDQKAKEIGQIAFAR